MKTPRLYKMTPVNRLRSREDVHTHEAKIHRVSVHWGGPEGETLRQWPPLEEVCVLSDAESTFWWWPYLATCSRPEDAADDHSTKCLLTARLEGGSQGPLVEPLTAVATVGIIWSAIMEDCFLYSFCLVTNGRWKGMAVARISGRTICWCPDRYILRGTRPIRQLKPFYIRHKATSSLLFLGL